MIRTIAWHEFWFTVKKKSYYLVTLGMPLLVAAYIGFLSIIVLVSASSEISKMGKPTGLIDRAGVLTADGGPLADAKIGEVFVYESEPQKIPDQVPDELAKMVEENIQPSKRNILLFSSVEELKEKLEDETIVTAVEIPGDYIEEGKFKVYKKRSELMGSGSGTGWLSRMIGKEILGRTGLTDQEKERSRRSAGSTEFEIGKSGDFEEVNMLAKFLSLGIPLAVAGLLIMALMMNASLLLASIAEEKENKVMEVIVSSVSAEQLLFGKVLAIVLAGLLQIAIWMTMISIVPWSVMMVMKEFVDYDIDVTQLAISGVFMVLGFMFYGSLLAGMGSLGSTYKDCQQLSAAVILCACLPMMIFTVFIQDPNALLPRILSFIPLFSPVGMALRLGAGEIATWEIGLSFVILLISILVAIKISARLFRAGTLMRGKPPGIREIWKVLTQPQ